jgi:hypothetical protein
MAKIRHARAPERTRRRGLVHHHALAFSTLLSSQETSTTPSGKLPLPLRGDPFKLPRIPFPAKSAFPPINHPETRSHQHTRRIHRSRLMTPRVPASRLPAAPSPRGKEDSKPPRPQRQTERETSMYPVRPPPKPGYQVMSYFHLRLPRFHPDMLAVHRPRSCRSM